MIVVLVLQLFTSVTKFVIWVASIRSEDPAVFAIVQLHIVMRVTMTMGANLLPSSLLLLARTACAHHYLNNASPLGRGYPLHDSPV